VVIVDLSYDLFVDASMNEEQLNIIVKRTNLVDAILVSLLKEKKYW